MPNFPTSITYFINSPSDFFKAYFKLSLLRKPASTISLLFELVTQEQVQHYSYYPNL